MASVLSEAYFHDEAAAFAALEGLLWSQGPVCPHCGGTERINRLNGVKDKKGRVRLGLWKCYDCRGQFTVRKGTIFEDSKVPLHQWFQAAYLMCASKKGVSSNQLARTLNVTLKTAWFMSHRLREAMRQTHIGPLGGEGKTVEFDETWVGGKEKNKHANKRHSVGGGYGKEAVLSLVERGGSVRSHHVPTVTGKTLAPILHEQIHEASAVYSDDGGARVGRSFAGHQSVNHSIKEYVRGPVHTNTIEGYFSIMKRGIVGVYHHVSPQHLKRYLAEFDFRYNNRSALGVEDRSRTAAAMKGAAGKRLTYKDSSLASV
jgi:transposase-like protein